MLIRELQTLQVLPDDRAALSQSLSLFRTHFLVFHCLYRLRDRLWQKQLAHLDISPLKITLSKYRAGTLSLTERDPLKDYYLNLANLIETSAQDVEKTLSDFWSKLYFQGYGSTTERENALKTLGLRDPVTAKEVKQQYRRLAMRHHPDRGGENEKLQQINIAMQILSLSWD